MISFIISTFYLGRYFGKSDVKKNVRPVSMWIVADAETINGRKFIYQAIKHIVSTVKTSFLYEFPVILYIPW